MNRLNRNKRTVYLCNAIIEDTTDRLIFAKPKKIKLNFLPLSSTGEIIAIGEEYIKRLVVYTGLDEIKQIHNGDRFYVYVDPPKNYDKTCATADYYVDGEPLKFINEGRFYLQRMTGEYGNV